MVERFFLKKIRLLIYEVEHDRLILEFGLGMTSKSIPGGALVGPGLRQVIGEITQKQWN